MDLKNERQVAVTREKIRRLEAHYESLRQKPAENAHARVLTLRSLKRMMNQMQEEIVRFESRAALQPSTGYPMIAGVAQDRI